MNSLTTKENNVNEYVTGAMLFVQYLLQLVSQIIYHLLIKVLSEELEYILHGTENLWK